MQHLSYLGAYNFCNIECYKQAINNLKKASQEKMIALIIYLYKGKQ